MASIIGKLLNLIGIEEYEEDDLPEQEPVTSRRNASYNDPPQYQEAPRPYAAQAPTYDRNSTSSGSQGAAKKGGRVVAHPSYDPNVKHQTTIYQINEHTETRAVIDDLLAGKSVLLNLENLDAVESQRVIDTLSGAAYAIEATLKKAAHQTYYIAPVSVEIAGNFSDEPRKAGGNLFGRGRTEP